MAYFKDLPLDNLECDPNQPRKDFGTDGDTCALMHDIREAGIEVPLAVMVVAPDRYVILDGHRRYKCAQNLKMATVPCRVYENLCPAEVERKRYNIQNNRRPWRPMERSNAIERIKQAANLKSDKQVAQFLGLSVSVVNCSLRIRREKMEYIEMMEHYGLAQSYRDEFLKLRPKIHKVKQFEVDDIIQIIFKKIEDGKIGSAKELRKVKRIFNRDSVNENALNLFLSDPDMTTTTLELNTAQSGFSGLLDQLMKRIGEALQIGKEFTPQEKPAMIKLRDMLNRAIGHE
ncbi:MAG: ParB N-terminal domain-containing protein [Patescibacteria group bacterium]|nr:ParB N-terminal domain-containing protein [Patescibacteria group bacterium]